jgi:hypothetical protein
LASGSRVGPSIGPISEPGYLIAEESTDGIPSSLAAWPDWFGRLVKLGVLLKTERVSGSTPKGTVFLVVALPTRQLGAAAIALGLVASSTTSQPQTSRALIEDDFKALEVGQTLRITKTFVAGGHEHVSTQTAHFHALRSSGSGKRELVVDTVLGGRERPATFRLGQGSTKFEIMTLPLGLHEQAVDTLSNGLASWIGPGANLVDFHASIHNELRWVGERTRIDRDIEHVVARGRLGVHSDAVKIGDLLRVRDAEGLTGRGWHTQIMSTTSEEKHQEKLFGASDFTILDGNRSVFRHINVVASRFNICIVDVGSGPRLNDALRAIEDRSRWGDQITLKSLAAWVPPEGSEVAAFAVGRA